jgi:hypothetical protein
MDNGPRRWSRIHKKLELDIELYSQGVFHPSASQPTVGLGGRYKIHSPIILLFMAGRSLESTSPTQSRFVGYFGLQFLLPPKSYRSDRVRSAQLIHIRYSRLAIGRLIGRVASTLLMMGLAKLVERVRRLIW